MIKDVVSFDNPKSRAAEAFRTLRTNIQFSAFDDSLKTIVITSSAPAEGKTTVLTNLAITLSQSGSKVLIVDCDLRKPSIHKKLALSNLEGLTNILVQNKKIEECIKVTEQKNLFVLTSGPIPPNPSELLGSKRMKNILTEFQQIFDYILIDAPPLLAVTDSQILSTVADGVIIVTVYGKTDKNSIMKSKDLLDKVGAKVIGFVLNKIPEKADSYYYSKYYSYYGESE